MRKTILLTCLLILSLGVKAQFFNTGSILKPGHFSAGFNPVIQNDQLGMYFHGGYGIRKTVDLAARYGFLDGKDYIGLDLEWALDRSQRFDLSLITGLHSRGDMGLDLGMVASIPVTGYATVFGGVDLDLDFGNDLDHYTWIPIGMEALWKNRMSIILEADLAMSEWAWNIFGGGIAVYF